LTSCPPSSSIDLGIFWGPPQGGELPWQTRMDRRRAKPPKTPPTRSSAESDPGESNPRIGESGGIAWGETTLCPARKSRVLRAGWGVGALG
jgi:hypothetical protein